MLLKLTLLVVLGVLGPASSQRKVSRNAAVTEVKTPVNFNCPEEFGYYPHPSDCTQYYVCVFGGALLESCTGGLMYSHELQTCDWPRNVGCDGAELSPATSAAPKESRTRYAPPTPPPPQPSAVVTSRGQPRQLQHQEIIKQRQQQLYADAEETLPPAEEIESDRQQRVYRGQPSTVGQVQKDRDGLRHSNAISSYSGRGERIGVISFGTQQQYSDFLTNDLTVKRRRKRQIQKSRIRSIQTTWRGGQQNQRTTLLNIDPYTLQPPPLQSIYTSSFAPSHLPDNDFQPFVPNYHKVPTHTVANKQPFTPMFKPSTTGGYLTSITTFRPPRPRNIKNSYNYYKHENVMVPQHTHIVTHNTSAVQITNPNIKPTTEENPFSDNFGPPASYFNTPNKYENLENPFANPNFNFDTFLTNLRADPFHSTTKVPKVTTTKKLPPPSDYYYYEDDYSEKNATTSAPKKIYSSQIKPTTNVVTTSLDDEYYYEYYDYPQNKFYQPINSTKFSAKYQTKPKIVTTTTPLPTTQKQFRTTIPTTKTSKTRQRHKQTDDVRKRVEQTTAAPVQPSISTARALYNSSQYNSNNYDPYYTLYDDDVELYRDVDYPQQYSSNNNNGGQRESDQSYRRTPSPVVQSTPEETPKRGNAQYIQNNYNSQDIYQPASGGDYNEDNTYNSQVDDQNSYRQINRQPTRGDRNDLNYFEEAATKRTTTSTTTRKTTTTRTTPRTIPPKKSTISSYQVTANESNTQAQSIINTLGENPGPSPLTPQPKNESDTTTYRPKFPDFTPKAIVHKPAPFTLPDHITTTTTEKPLVFHYITKSSRSTTLVSEPTKKQTVIVPTTYSPPKFFLKSLTPKSVVNSTPKTLKTIRKLISPISVNYGLSGSEETTTFITKITNASTPLAEPVIQVHNTSEKKKFRTTVEVPPPRDLSEEDEQKEEPDQAPEYKIQPFHKPPTTPSPNSSLPARVSRVNAAIKSLIAFGGTRRQNGKCNDDADSKCNDQKQRTNTRGRGSAHYSNGGSIANNEVTVTVNRGTPASRPRPTLKPSTSIVSKASEFIDIYRFPPIRPEPIYPQPQPDKTAAKCRKDVCLLPDCYCGGKEIPGDLPVEQLPQIVLLTFDDSVNDLNKGLYSDLFEKGRVNPNGCPIAATFYVSHEWTDYSQVQNLYSDGHEIASHTVSHSFGEQFSQKKWTREVAGQREILSAYGGVHLEDVRGMRAPFLSVGGNKMFKMLYDSNFTYDSSMPIYENKPPSWPYTLDYKLFHDCMIPPCPTRSYPGVWEVPMVMWQDLNGGRCSMGDACSNPPDAEGVFKMLTKNFQRHYTTNRAPFGLFYHAAWFTQPHHKEGFINFLDSILQNNDVWLVTNWQAIQWVRDPTPISRLGSFQPFQCDYADRPKRCNNPKVCNLWHKSGVRYMRTCQPCPDIYPWTGNTGIRSSRIDNDIDD